MLVKPQRNETVVSHHPTQVGQLGLLQFHPGRTSFVNLSPLQRAQNAAAWIVLGLSPRDLFRPALRELHHLPYQLKISLLMYLAYSYRCPSYMSRILSSVSNNPGPWHRLRHTTHERTESQADERCRSVTHRTGTV